MNPINFREIEKNIGNRSQEILNLHQEIPKYLTFDEKLKVIVDPDFQEQALTLVKKVNEMKKINAADKNLMQRARELSTKYDLQINRSGHISNNPEVLDLDKIEGEARQSIMSLEYPDKTGVF